MKRYVLGLFFLVVLILGLSLCFVDLAFSIPTSQQDCDLDTQSNNSATHAVVPNTSVTVNNGNIPELCNYFQRGASTAPRGM